MRNNDMDLLLRDFGRNLGEVLRTSLAPAIFDRDGATVNPTEFAQSLVNQRSMHRSRYRL